jgi:hypothetical protein
MEYFVNIYLMKPSINIKITIGDAKITISKVSSKF